MDRDKGPARGVESGMEKGPDGSRLGLKSFPITVIC